MMSIYKFAFPSMTTSEISNTGSPWDTTRNRSKLGDGGTK